MDKPTAPLSAEARVKAKVYDAHHSLGQYAYIRGFEDCSDEIWIQQKKGEPWKCIVSDADCESTAWERAASRIEAQEKEQK